MDTWRHALNYAVRRGTRGHVETCIELCYEEGDTWTRGDCIGLCCEEGGHVDTWREGT